MFKPSRLFTTYIVHPFPTYVELLPLFPHMNTVGLAPIKPLTIDDIVQIYHEEPFVYSYDDVMASITATDVAEFALE